MISSQISEMIGSDQKVPLRRFAFALLLVASAIGSAESAKGQTKAQSAAKKDILSCAVGLLTSQQIASPRNSSNSSFNPTRIDVEIEDGEGSTSAVIQGREVELILARKEHLELFHATVVLQHPPGVSLPPGSRPFELALSDYLYFDGQPQSEWDSLFDTVGRQPQVAVYRYLGENGSLMLSSSFVELLKRQGMWGTYPFTSQKLSITLSSLVVEEAENLHRRGLLSGIDVIGLYTAFVCNRWTK